MARKLRGRNEGSISRRTNGSWRAQVTVNDRRVSMGFKNKAEAQSWIRKMQEQMERGYDLSVTKTTLEEYLNKWLASSRVTLRPKTVVQYEYILSKYLIPLLGRSLLKDLHPVMIETKYANLVTEGVGVRTIRLVHSILHRALEKAIRYRILSYNPAGNLSLPRYKAEEITVLDECEVSAFLVAAHERPLDALYHLALVTGMRQGELFGLKWTDLHWSSGTIDVQRQVQQVPGQGWIFQEPKTRAGRRTIQLGEGTLQALRAHRVRQERQRAVAGDRWQENGLIFTSSCGTPLNPSNMRKDFNRVLVGAGVPKIRFHDLRHTAASLMLNHGIAPIVVSQILGHSKPSTTLDIYGHFMYSMQGDAARVMDGLITPVQVQLPELEGVKMVAGRLD